MFLGFGVVGSLKGQSPFCYMTVDPFAGGTNNRIYRLAVAERPTFFRAPDSGFYIEVPKQVCRFGDRCFYPLPPKP